MTNAEIAVQQRREHPEPYEQTGPIPWFVFVLTACLMTFGIVYIVRANVDTPSEWGDGRTHVELAGTRPAQGTKIDGAALFASACVACHQATGSGLPGVFPPLAGSEWVQGKESTVAAIVLQGLSGSINVKGAAYAGAMPSFKAQFSDEQIAAVLSHIRAEWGNGAAPISSATVASVREQLKARTEPFAGEKELAALP